MAKNKKIVRYRKPLNINVGMIIFAMIFVYLSFSVYTYLRRDHVQFYEVVEGSIVNNKEYNGILFRDETVENAPQTGYVNYYVREGKRAGAGARVYSLDETGELGKFLEENQSSGVSLSAENLADLKKQLSSFCLSYNDQRFESVYDAKYSLQASVAEYMNFNALGDMDAQLQAQGINYKQISTPQPGIISYVTDSFEGVAPEEVTADSFDRSQYTRQVGRAGELIESGTPVYKIITSENWSIVFQMDDKDKEQFADQDTLTIEPLGSDMKFRGNYSMFTGSDGNLYGRLDLDRYMIQFESERFMTFEISSKETQGLKIPVSSVMEKEILYHSS